MWPLSLACLCSHSGTLAGIPPQSHISSDTSDITMETNEDQWRFSFGSSIAQNNQATASHFPLNSRKTNKAAPLLLEVSWGFQHAVTLPCPTNSYYQMNFTGKSSILAKTNSSKCGLKLQRNWKTRNQALPVENYICLCFLAGSSFCY